MLLALRIKYTANGMIFYVPELKIYWLDMGNYRHISLIESNEH